MNKESVSTFHSMNFFRFLGLGAALVGLPLSAHGQELVPVAPDNTLPDNGQAPLGGADDEGGGIDVSPLAPGAAPVQTALDAATQSALDRTNALLEDKNPAALPLARDTAQNTLKALNAAVGGTGVGNAALSQTISDDQLSIRLAVGAIQAHALWGRAADSFGRRDEAITALVRAKALLAALPIVPDKILARDVNLQLNTLLRAGLPLVAPDDVLTAIAARSHENLWHARRFDFAANPSLPSKTALLVTEGQLFPPAERGQDLVRIPPLYRGIASDRLPSSLQLNRMIAGYTRISSGPQAGQWRQSVRVFYASPFLTRNKRDDSSRAQALAAQFLRVHSLFESQLGATNLYAHGPLDEGVTTLYLLEISALWPQDDDDPVVLANLGPKMPPVNTGPKPGALQAPVTPLMRPWMPIAGRDESAPGEILFWKAGFSRSEGEWVRELFHEYGHVALPPFGGFRPPLEPYGNGLLGETLGMMWAAQNPDFSGPNGAGVPRSDFLLHVSKQAVPARAAFLLDNPTAARTGGTLADLRFLQGLAVVCERTYGAPILGRAFAPLAQQGANTPSVAARRGLFNAQDFLSALEPAMRSAFASRHSLSIYLPASLDLGLDATALVNRSPIALRAGSRASGWLFVPAGATSLLIESPNLSAIGLPWKREVGATRVYFGGKSGWQRVGLLAQGNATLQKARFE